MTIEMPIVIGIHAHPSLHSKVDAAIAAKDFPILLDCKNTTFTTSMFYRFVITIHRKIKDGGGTMKVINVDEALYDALMLCNAQRVLEVYKKGEFIG